MGSVTSSCRAVVCGENATRFRAKSKGLRCSAPRSRALSSPAIWARRVTKGHGSRAAGIAMAFKLIESAQTRWRAVNAPHLVALVRAGAKFENGKVAERADESGGDAQAA